MTEAPKTGDVFHYPYLWAWQADLGETEGRKDRPCCVALVIPLKYGLNRVYILPINTKEPAGDEAAISIPRTEVSRAGLSSDYDQWIILSEWNRGHCQVVCQRLQLALAGEFRWPTRVHSHSKDRARLIGHDGMRW